MKLAAIVGSVATLVVVGATVTVAALGGDLTTTASASSTSASPSASSSPSGSSTGNDKPATTIDPELIKALQSIGNGVPCTQIVPKADLTSAGNVKPNLGFDKPVLATEGHPAERAASDDLSTKLAGSTDPARASDVLTKVCEDPVYGSSWGETLYNLPLGASGKTIGSLPGLDWLKPVSATSAIRTHASIALPTYGTPNATSDQATVAADRFQDYQVFAAKVVALLKQFHSMGVKTGRTATSSLHLVVPVAPGTIPDVAVDPNPDTKPVYQLALDQKDTTCDVATVGANLEDSRPEVLTNEGCAPPPTPKGTPTTGTPAQGCTTNCGGGGCTTNCGGGGCTTNCGSTPSSEAPKPPQSEECQQNGGPGCPPNGGHQDPQSPVLGQTSVSTAPAQSTPSSAPTTPKPIVSGTPPVVDSSTPTAIGTCPPLTTCP